MPMPLTTRVASQRRPHGHSRLCRRRPVAGPAFGHAEAADTGPPEAIVVTLVAVVRVELAAELSLTIIACRIRWIVDEVGGAILVNRCGLIAEIRVQAVSTSPKNRSGSSSRGWSAIYTPLESIRVEVR